MVCDEGASGIVRHDVDRVAAWVNNGVVGHEAAAPVAPAL
ncbi:hypothetical protein L479_02563 [Exiguobacterium sp. S17]|nr:hypothetical protein L479_02563 [Exiguobacterium sp. S17]